MVTQSSHLLFEETAVNKNLSFCILKNNNGRTNAPQGILGTDFRLKSVISCVCFKNFTLVIMIVIRENQNIHQPFQHQFQTKNITNFFGLSCTLLIWTLFGMKSLFGEPSLNKN